MKIAANRADAFARNPDDGVRAVLVYGPDDGLVRARGNALTKAVVEDPADPFRIAEVSAAGLRDAPSLIADEAAAIALTGGRRVVRFRDAPFQLRHHAPRLGEHTREILAEAGLDASEIDAVVAQSEAFQKS